MATVVDQQPVSTAARTGIVDCDVHPYPVNTDEIRAFMPMPWRDRFTGGGRGHFGNPVHGSRLDSNPSQGGPAGSDPGFLRSQLIDEFGIAYAVLLPRAFSNVHPDPDMGTAIAAAYNDWLDATWLSTHNPDGVFKGSISINTQDPAAAGKEIDRWAGHPHMVQVMTDSGARAPFGQRQYHPIFEACQRNGLRFAIHPGTDGMGINVQPSPGYPTHYIEWHTGLSLAFQAHLISLLTEGVFERYPGLGVTLVEGGVSWLAPLIWRLDAEWKALRSEVPWLTRAPSAYLRDHLRLSSQPIENPDNPKHLLSMLEMMDAEHLVMFASDYPHWDFDSPTHAFSRLPEAMRERIFSTNARDWYGLPQVAARLAS